MITLADYVRGYDVIYKSEFTPEIAANAAVTIGLVNLLIEEMQAGGVKVENNPRYGNPINSGWRPPLINANVKGAAPRSKHMTGQACDLYDPEGDLDDWCMAHADKLAEIGLWQEHPSATKGWLHVQTVPPRSGNRVFYP